MDRSLWLLIWLKGRAWVRRVGRKFLTLKGVLLAIVGILFFLPMIVSTFLAPRIQTAGQFALIREYGALALFGYCLLNVLLSSGERAISYSPSEINFLFPGPYLPRQILLYRVAGGTITALLTSLAMCFAFRQHAPNVMSAFVGMFLAFELLYLFSMCAGLLLNTLGAVAFNFWRRVAFAGVAVIAFAALYPLGTQALSMSPSLLLSTLMANPIVTTLLYPFKPPAMAFASERLFPDLIQWTVLGMAVNFVFLLLNLGLNRQFLERTAVSSAKLHAKLQKRGRASITGPIGKVRFRLPMLPRFRGVGPVAWRQSVTASRTPSRFVAMILMFVIPMGTVMIVGRQASEPAESGPIFSLILGLAFFVPSMIGYDFRTDFDRMEELKVLPISPLMIVIGQLTTPFLILCALEWISLGCLVSLTNGIPHFLLEFALSLIPLNIILIAIENLYFLWFPFQLTGINALDLQSMGRQFLLIFAKLITVGLIAGMAFALGWLSYYLSGYNVEIGLAVSWFLMTSMGLGLLPVVAVAFRHFDVNERIAE